MSDIYSVGIANLFLNAFVAFLLNVSLVLLVRNDWSRTSVNELTTLQIGKTSSLVLTLCGVLKDILLVAASIMIWGTPVTATQFFGYAVALSGLVYYKIGREELFRIMGSARRGWSEFGAQRPAMRHIVIVGLVLFFMLILVGGLFPHFAAKSTGWLRELLGGSKLSS
jgi:hypothetical protein